MNTPIRTPRRRALRVVLVVACALATVWSAVRFSRLVGTSAAPVAVQSMAPAPPLPRASFSDVEASAYRRHLPRGPAWGNALAMQFGGDAVAYTTASAPDAPELVFARAAARARDDESVVADAFLGWRALTRIERIERDGDGGVRTGTTSVVLAVPRGAGWDYLSFFFPRGLTLDSLRQSPPTLGPASETLGSLLQPVFRAPSASGSNAVLARARDGKDILQAAAKRLHAAGWNLGPTSGEETAVTAQTPTHRLVLRVLDPDQTLVSVEWQKKGA